MHECQSLFSGRNKKTINLLSAESAQKVVAFLGNKDIVNI